MTDAEQHDRDDEGRWSDDLGGHLDRLWNEVKELTRQVESETRRGGKIARLRFEVRGRRRDLAEEMSRLGQLIYEAQRNSARRPALARVKGYDEAIARIDVIRADIEARLSEIEALGGDVGRYADAA